jgi:hypothetical protein
MFLVETECFGELLAGDLFTPLEGILGAHV